MTFKEFVDKMVEVYGVSSYLNNEDDVAEGNMWVTCPECDEPILEGDWSMEEVAHGCPICGFDWEEDLQ